MDQAQKNLATIETFVNNLPAKNTSSKNTLKTDFNVQIGEVNLKNCLEKFRLAVNDDLNTPLALSIIYRGIKAINKISDLTPEEKETIAYFWQKVNKVLGLKITPPSKENSIPEEIKNLAEKREKARQNKDFELADKLRDEIVTKGYLLKDTSNGFTLEKK